VRPSRRLAFARTHCSDTRYSPAGPAVPDGAPIEKRAPAAFDFCAKFGAHSAACRKPAPAPARRAETPQIDLVAFCAKFGDHSALCRAKKGAPLWAPFTPLATSLTHVQTEARALLSRLFLYVRVAGGVIVMRTFPSMWRYLARRYVCNIFP
jgi:hypothetical protein